MPNANIPAKMIPMAVSSFIAHAILNQLREDRKKDLIEFFHQQKRDVRHQHSIWHDIQAKNVYSSEFLYQKMEYIHSNPVSKDWQLVEDRAQYKYSRACHCPHCSRRRPRRRYNINHSLTSVIGMIGASP